MVKDEEDFVDLARRGFNAILKLSKSQKVSVKLTGLNGLLVAVIVGVQFVYLFFPNADFTGFTIGFVFGFAIGLVGMLGYLPILEMLVNFIGGGEKKISALKLSIY